MVRIEYMQALENELYAGGLSREEVYDIARDYAEYFEEGVRNNKTEQQVINDLGDPRVVACQILEESKSAQTGARQQASNTVSGGVSLVKTMPVTNNSYEPLPPGEQGARIAITVVGSIGLVILALIALAFAVASVSIMLVCPIMSIVANSLSLFLFFIAMGMIGLSVLCITGVICGFRGITRLNRGGASAAKREVEFHA